MSDKCYQSHHQLIGEPGNGLYLRLTGQTTAGLVEFEGHYVAPAIVEPFLRLRSLAAESGFDLQIVSGYRSLEKQANIWRAKAAGQRTLWGEDGGALDFHSLSEAELLRAIMRWSAIPGASRHHWGTDIDIYDAAALPRGYQLQLTASECEPGGVMGEFHSWLGQRMADSSACGFYRPYVQDLGGVSPEPWHLSFGPCAGLFEKAYDETVFATLLGQLDIPLIERIRDQKSSLFSSYISNTASPTQESSC